MLKTALVLRLSLFAVFVYSADLSEKNKVPLRAAPAPHIPSAIMAASPWLPTSPGTIRPAAGGSMEFLPSPGLRTTFYTAALDSSYGLSFTIDGSRSHYLSICLGYQTANGQPLFRVFFPIAGKPVIRRENQPDLVLQTGAEGSWDILVNGAQAVIRRNGASLASFVVPSVLGAIWLETEFPTGVTGASRSLILQNVALTGSRKEPGSLAFRQWPIGGSRPRNFTFLWERSKHQFTSAQTADLPLLHQKLEEILKKPLGVQGPSGLTGDPVLAVWDDTSGGRNSPWTYVPPFTVGASQTVAHELGHWNGPLVSGRDWAEETWVYEGLADFLANLALNRLQGRPDWVFNSHFFTGRHWVGANGQDYPLGSAAALGLTDRNSVEYKELIRQSYLKGHLFLWLLAEETGWERFLEFVRKPAVAQTGTAWVDELARFTGKDLSAFKQGWLTRGAYTRFTPDDFTDPNREGLLRFQKKLRGLDISRPDSQRPGVSDLFVLMEGRYSLPRMPSGEYLDGVPAMQPPAGAQTLTAGTPGAYAWKTRWALKTSSDWEISAQRDKTAALPENLNITYFLFGTSRGRLKLTVKDGQINELVWADEGNRKPAVPDLPRIKETSAGLELVLPQALLEGRELKNIYFNRLGLSNGVWIESPGGTLEIRAE